MRDEVVVVPKLSACWVYGDIEQKYPISEISEILLSFCNWLTDNPITPTSKRIREHFFYHYPDGVDKDKFDEEMREFIGLMNQEMFVNLGTEIPEELFDITFVTDCKVDGHSANEMIVEAYKRGIKSQQQGGV
jgi:hypothetical protein